MLFDFFGFRLVGLGSTARAAETHRDQELVAAVVSSGLLKLFGSLRKNRCNATVRIILLFRRADHVDVGVIYVRRSARPRADYQRVCGFRGMVGMTAVWMIAYASPSVNHDIMETLKNANTSFLCGVNPVATVSMVPLSFHFVFVGRWMQW